VQTCIWPSWCHCHSLSLASVKSRLVLPFWYQLTRVVPERGPLNVCVCVSFNFILHGNEFDKPCRWSGQQYPCQQHTKRSSESDFLQTDMRLAEHCVCEYTVWVFYLASTAVSCPQCTLPARHQTTLQTTSRNMISPKINANISSADLHLSFRDRELIIKQHTLEHIQYIQQCHP